MINSKTKPNQVATSEITVVGAGFSGLVTAYYLIKKNKNIKITVLEKSDRIGGLIQSIKTEYGVIETAANGFLDNPELRDICSEIGVDLVERSNEAKKRYIFRDGKPRRLPLFFGEVLVLTCRFFVSLILNKTKPLKGESVLDWGTRVLGKSGLEYLLIPALNGIYAGDPKKLSAHLIFGSSKKRNSNLDAGLSDKKIKADVRTKAKIKMKTVAPKNGMGEFCEKLYLYLVSKGVNFYFNHEYNKAAQQNYNEVNIFFAVSLKGAQNLKIIDQVAQTNNMLSVTCFFEAVESNLRGFGCVFPNIEKFNSLGVLFNSCVFENRVKNADIRSETWIMGGALSPDLVFESDKEILSKIRHDRKRAFGLDQEPIFYRVQRWPQSLPHYTIDLQNSLENLNQSCIVGNYLGQIGLSKIIYDIKDKIDKV